MNRYVPLPIAVVVLVVVLLSTIVVVRATTPPPHQPDTLAPQAGPIAFEPSADNVSSDLSGRLHALRQRVATDPTDTAAVLELARTLHDAHQPAEAASYYDRYLKGNPGNSEVWYDLADSHGRAGNWEAARRVIESVLARMPDEGTALYNMGVIEIQLGNDSAARGWLERAATLADTETVQRARDALAALDRGGEAP